MILPTFISIDPRHSFTISGRPCCIFSLFGNNQVTGTRLPAGATWFCWLSLPIALLLPNLVSMQMRSPPPFILNLASVSITSATLQPRTFCWETRTWTFVVFGCWQHLPQILVALHPILFFFGSLTLLPSFQTPTTIPTPLAIATSPIYSPPQRPYHCLDVRNIYCCFMVGEVGASTPLTRNHAIKGSYSNHAESRQRVPTNWFNYPPAARKRNCFMVGRSNGMRGSSAAWFDVGRCETRR